MSKRWVTIEKAHEETGLPEGFLHDHTSPAGAWPENAVWKWFEGRKMIDLAALYEHIDKAPSVASQRGRRRTPANEPQHAASA